MLPDDWKDWKQCTDSNLYVRIGLDPRIAASYTIDEIKRAIKERVDWWNKKPRSQPIWSERIRLAESALAEARLILTDTDKKQKYDEKLKEELLDEEKKKHENNIKSLIELQIIPAISKDKILSPEEEENIIFAAARLGISESECKNIIGNVLKEDGAKRGKLNKVTIADNIESFRQSIYAAIINGWLEPKAKWHLIQSAKAIGIDKEDAEKIITECLREKNAKVGSPERLDLPIELQGKNYYEILGIPENAKVSEIEAAFKEQFNRWNSLASVPKYRRYVDSVKELLQEVRNTLLDPVRRERYDESIEEIAEEQDAVSTADINPILELSKTELSFTDILPGSICHDIIYVENHGDQEIDATISTRSAWLDVIDKKIKIHENDGINIPEPIIVEVDTRKDKKCVLGFNDTGFIEISYTYAGRYETIRIPVKIDMQTAYQLAANKSAEKLSSRATIISAILGSSAFIYLLFMQKLSIWGILGLIFTVILIIVAIFEVAEDDIAKGVGMFIGAGLLLFLVNKMLLIVLLPIPLTWLASIFLFERYPLKSNLAIIIPVIACSGCFTLAYLSLQPSMFRHSDGHSVSPPDVQNQVATAAGENNEVNHIKTEEEEVGEVLTNPSLDNYLAFIKKYPSTKRKEQLISKVKSADTNLPHENYWGLIKKNEKGYWEMYYQKFIWLVWVPPSKHIKSNERGEQRNISLKGFWIGKYEVSIKQYKKYCKENNIGIPANAYDDAEPIRNVNWEEAFNFCKWFGFRLPTELEWETAARGGKNFNNYPWGETFDPAFCNVGSNKVTKIGSFKENGYSLYDVVGNVEEWCQDWYSKDIFTVSDNPLYKILKGGSFKDSPENATIMRRNYMFPSYRKETYGFRVVME